MRERERERERERDRQTERETDRERERLVILSHDLLSSSPTMRLAGLDPSFSVKCQPRGPRGQKKQNRNT